MKPVTLKRYENNPVMSGNPQHDWEWQFAFNPGAAIHDGKVYILYRAAGKKPKNPGTKFHESRIGLAVSENGYDISYRHPEPVIDWSPDDEDELGIFGISGAEDPRITKIGDTYYIVYTITSDSWDRLALATTKDFKTFTKHGLILEDIAQRTAGLFPEKYDDKFLILHRPIPNIWISESRDLKTFENPKMILTNRILPWCEMKLGMCAPPIRMKNAWMVIFHGRDRHNTYRLGVFWLDLDDPTKVLKVQEQPILEPEAEYEKKQGITSNCVYACGAVEMNGDILVYYGACDGYTCVASAPRKDFEI